MWTLIKTVGYKNPSCRQYKHPLLSDNVNKYKHFVEVSRSDDNDNDNELPQKQQRQNFEVNFNPETASKFGCEDPIEILAKFTKGYAKATLLKSIFGGQKAHYSMMPTIDIVETGRVRSSKNKVDEDQTRNFRLGIAKPILLPEELQRRSTTLQNKMAALSLSYNVDTLKEQYRRYSKGVQGTRMVQLMEVQPNKDSVFSMNPELWRSIHNNQIAKLFTSKCNKNRRALFKK